MATTPTTPTAKQLIDAAKIYAAGMVTASDVAIGDALKAIENIGYIAVLRPYPTPRPHR